jgi:hypothetical protein
MFCGELLRSEADTLRVRLSADGSDTEATFHAHRSCVVARLYEKLRQSIRDSDPRAFDMLR